MLRKAAGFTLAELLISLAILGVIATFTIPKIIGAAGNGQNTAIAKEAASMIAGSMSTYQLNNSLASSTTGGALTQYMNYVSVDTTATTMASCATAGTPCLKLHNGGYLQYGTGAFGATNGATSALYFDLDPDGGGPQTSVTFVQYYGGRLTTMAQAIAGATTPTTGATQPTSVITDPAYIQNWN